MLHAQNQFFKKLAKIFGIKLFFPTVISSKELKTKLLLKYPKLKEGILELIGLKQHL